MSATTFRLPEAADIIGASALALRRWLGHDGVALAAERSHGEWAEFDVADIALFAAMAELVRFGIAAREAFEIARDNVLEHPKHRAAFERWRRAGAPTQDAVAGALANRVLIVHREGDKAHARVTDWRSIESFHTGPKATLLLDLAECIGAVMARVRAR